MRTISVIIPSRDRPKSLHRVLRHLAETIPEAEVIVVDDGSAIPITSDGLVRVIRQEESLGRSAARNLGAKLAHGEILAFMDDDILPSGRSWSRLVKLLEHSDAVWAGPRLIIEGEPHYPPGEALGDVLIVEHLPAGFLVTTRSTFESSGGFNQRIHDLDDYELTTRARRAGHTLLFDPHVEAVHADPSYGFRESALRDHDWILATPQIWAQGADQQQPLDDWTYGMFCTALLPRRRALRWIAAALVPRWTWALYRRVIPRVTHRARLAAAFRAMAHVRGAQKGFRELPKSKQDQLCSACRAGIHSSWVISKINVP
jgi:glycosyltransferase involved in cell wall biosynthesis